MSYLSSTRFLNEYSMEVVDRKFFSSIHVLDICGKREGKMKHFKVRLSKKYFCKRGPVSNLDKKIL